MDPLRATREKRGEYRPEVLGISAEEFKKLSDEFNSIEEAEDVPCGNEVGPVQKTCNKCNRIHRRLFAHSTPIGDYCSGCGGLLVDTSYASIINLINELERI